MEGIAGLHVYGRGYAYFSVVDRLYNRVLAHLTPSQHYSPILGMVGLHAEVDPI